MTPTTASTAHHCQRRTLSQGPYGSLTVCDCPVLHLTIGPVTVRLDRAGAQGVLELLSSGLGAEQEETWPPPPHDPRERETKVTCEGWDVLAFADDDPRHRYFAARSFAHLQLWHPQARVSVLTPSRLTRDAFELCAADLPKERFELYSELEARLKELRGVALPPAPTLLAVERLLLRKGYSEETKASSVARSASDSPS